jgi:L-threonylcarbamoyladenylate synthase
MQTVILEDSEATRAQVAEVIAGGGVIAFRTDTFYGLGADPFNHAAVQRIKQLKASHNPILIVVSDHEAVDRFITQRSPAFDLLAKTFWPGPLTLIGKATSNVPDEITAATQTVGVRLPDDDRVRALVRVCGGALTATSANPSHQQPGTSAQKVFNYFGTAIDLIVDGGAVTAEQPSTVLDVSGAEPRLVREGATEWSEILATIQRF